MIIGTVTVNSQLHKTIVLVESIKKHMPDCKVVVCLVEEKLPVEFQNYYFFDELVLAKEIGFDNFYRFIFQYDMYEGPLACKPQLMKYLLNKYPEEGPYVFLNSEMRVYAPLEHLVSILKKKDIIFTPHHVRFPEDFNGKMGKWYSKYGLFNSSFLAVNHTAEAEEFLTWWARRCNNYCYVDYNTGLFMDQKWLEYAPCYFSVHSLKHPGYNVAFWNIEERRIRKGEANSYIINGLPLSCFNFTDCDTNLINKLNNVIPEEQKLVYELLSEYKGILHHYEKKELVKKEWDYSKFFSGEKIEKTLREKYRHSHLLQDQFPRPFYMSNEAILPLSK